MNTAKNIMIITGGTSGLGLEMVKQSIEKGLFVCNIARNEQKMKELEVRFTKNYKGFTGNITNEKFISESIKEIATLGNIQYLINCAEKACFKSPIQYNSEDIEMSLSGLKGMILCSTEVLKAKNEKDIKTNEKQQEELKNKLASLGKKIDEMDKSGLTIEEEIKVQEEWINTLNNSGCKNRNDKITECMGMPMISRLIKPFNTGYVSSDYYWRISPITGFLETHSGIDLSTYTPAEGTPIHPVGAGVIGAKVYYKDCGGNMLYIYHNVNGNLYTSVYMHLLNFNESFQVGDIVTENDIIGNMGGWSTSSDHGGYDDCTTGAHLHLTLAYGHTTNHRAYMFNPRNLINFPYENGWFYGRY